MRVLFIAPFDLTIRDGTSIRVLNSARAATRICERVFLISYTTNEELEALNNLVHIRIRAVQLRYHFIMALADSVDSRLTSKFAMRFSGLNSVMMRNMIKNVDVIHVHWLLFSYLAKSLQLLIGQQIPTVVDLHGLFRLQESLKTSVRDTLAHTLGLMHEATAVRDKSIKAFTVPSKSLGKFLELTYGIDPRKVFEVRDAVEPEVLTSAKRCNEVNKEVKELIRDDVESYSSIAYMGTISRYHGFFDLLEAFNIVKRILRKKLKLILIVPSSQQLAKFRKILPEDTLVLENIPRKLIPCILRSASILILPHRAGTQFDYLPSNKIYDYMLAGRPIVAYKTPAIEEVLSRYDIRILVEPNNPMALAKGVIKALELWRDSEPTPAFDDVPTLKNMERSLRIVYRIASKADLV
jgi:glycosyltransferase involved in cell wall biosynthesis